MSRRLCACVLLCAVAACGGNPPARPAPGAREAAHTPARQPPSLPDRLTDEEFWALSTSLSEPDGSFRSDNLLSNELFMQYVIPQLTETVRSGGVYLGVGPEQNFTYIAATRPAMVFIVDVRRGNLDLHLLYKALFELSDDRVEFVSRLFARRRPAAIAPDADINAIFEAVYHSPTDEAIFAEDLHAVVEHLTKTRHLPLAPADVLGIQYAYRAFQTFGPGLTYWSSGYSGGRFNRNAPTYWDLMVLTDQDRKNWSYLASDAAFAFVKQLEARNLLVPVIGNFAGNKALRAVGAWLAARRATVSTFYLSNVEQYLYMDGLWNAFCGNVAALPLDETSTFIRSVRSGQFGYGPGPGLASELGNIKEDVRNCTAVVF
jgi:hypothetical protein